MYQVETLLYLSNPEKQALSEVYFVFDTQLTGFNFNIPLKSLTATNMAFK